MSELKTGDVVVCIHPRYYKHLTYPTGLEKGVSYLVKEVVQVGRGEPEIRINNKGDFHTFKIGRFIKINI